MDIFNHEYTEYIIFEPRSFNSTINIFIYCYQRTVQNRSEQHTDNNKYIHNTVKQTRCSLISNINFFLVVRRQYFPSYDTIVVARNTNNEEHCKQFSSRPHK